MTTYYLNADIGVDSGAGGIGAPWKTLVYAVAHSITGDTLYCQNSVATYDFRNTTITNRIITGQSVDGVVFDGAVGNYAWTANNGVVTMSNIWFKNISATSQSIFRRSVSSSLVWTVTNCRFSDITIFASYFSALFGSGDWGEGQITLTINSCVFDDIQAYAPGMAYPAMFNIYAATIGSTFSMNNCTYINRTSTTYVPIFLGSYSLGTFDFVFNIKNSIFRNLQGSIQLLQPFWSDVIATFTNCDLNGSWDTTGTSLVNCITSNPLFVDENNGNFNLRPSSPCRNTGVII
jgi:hypothetical protein